MSTDNENGNGNATIGIPGLLGRWAQMGAVGGILILLGYKVMIDDPRARREAREFTDRTHTQFIENDERNRQNDRERTARLYQAINNLADEMRRTREQ